MKLSCFVSEMFMLGDDSYRKVIYLPSLAVLLVPGRVGDLKVYGLDVQLDGATLREASTAVLALVALLACVHLITQLILIRHIQVKVKVYLFILDRRLT